MALTTTIVVAKGNIVKTVRKEQQSLSLKFAALMSFIRAFANGSQTYAKEEFDALRSKGVNTFALQKYVQIKTIASKPNVRVTALSATSGVITIGGSVGLMGMATGAGIGAAVGFVPAIFTFGLSIPVGAFMGGAFGLCVGTIVGGSAGLVRGAIKGAAKASTEQVNACRDIASVEQLSEELTHVRQDAALMCEDIVTATSHVVHPPHHLTIATSEADVEAPWEESTNGIWQKGLKELIAEDIATARAHVVDPPHELTISTSEAEIEAFKEESTNAIRQKGLNELIAEDIARARAYPPHELAIATSDSEVETSEESTNGIRQKGLKELIAEDIATARAHVIDPPHEFTIATSEAEVEASKEESTNAARIAEATSWRVVHSTNVRKNKDVVSEAIGFKNAGTEVDGSQEGDWLRLCGEPGYMRRIDPAGGATLLIAKVDNVDAAGIGSQVTLHDGRKGEVTRLDLEDPACTYKIKFEDGSEDWVPQKDVAEKAETMWGPSPRLTP
jgi:hypothetical protein